VVRNRTEFEKIINPEVLSIIDKYHKHLASELKINIQFNSRSFKFSLTDFFKIIKENNVSFKKELEEKKLTGAKKRKTK
tara:strand:- start:215 stop:451 length:237 start_codon:yes stop_codon:yes gene_type:complete